MKKQKIIYNLGKENEKTEYFDRLTIKRIKNKENYILMNYDDFFQCYIPYDYKLEKEQKRLFDEFIYKYNQ